MDVIRKFGIEPAAQDVWPGYYNVSVWTSVDGGHGFYYCGNGRFCKNLTEVFAYIRTWNNPWYEVVDYRDRRAPNAEIVTEMPDGFIRDMTCRDRPTHGVWIDNYRTGERKLLYTGRE